MASSPTPSLESLPGATQNSIGSFGEPTTDYLSDSPLTTLSGSATGSSPPASDSAICDDHFLLTSNSNSSIDTASSSSSSSASLQHINSEQQQQSAATSLAAAIAQSSAAIGINNHQYPPHCTGCKNKKSDAVAKCIDCANYLCSNCVTAHQFMHCFSGHSVFRINSLSNSPPQQDITSSSNNDLQHQLLQYNNKMNAFDSHRLTSLSNNTSSSIISNGVSMKEDANHIIKSMMNSIMSPPSLTASSIANNNINHKSSSDSSATSPISMSQVALSSAEAIMASANMNKSNRYFCTKHTSETLKFYCRTCQMAICKDCMVLEHPNGLHDCEHNTDQTPKMVENLLQLINELRSKAHDMKQLVKSTDHSSARIQIQYHKAQNEINETYQFYRSMLDERKQELLKELDSFYNAKTMSQSVLVTKSQEQIDKVLTSCDCIEKFSRTVGPNELVMLKRIMETKLQSFVSSINDMQSIYELDFVSNYQAIQVGVRNTFGYIRSSSETLTSKQPPIARPTSTTLTNGSSPPSSNGSLSGMMQNNNHSLLNGCHNGLSSQSLIERPFSNGGSSSNSGMTSSSSPNQLHSAFDSSLLSKRFQNMNSLGPFIGNDLIISSHQQ